MATVSNGSMIDVAVGSDEKSRVEIFAQIDPLPFAMERIAEVPVWAVRRTMYCRSVATRTVRFSAVDVGSLIGMIADLEGRY
ncbi:MAG: hypothetical protein KAT00_06850 [Planctomycetes bacterium]|nr:hypothetical protein [Planctomycetota bacterium]